LRASGGGWGGSLFSCQERVVVAGDGLSSHVKSEWWWLVRVSLLMSRASGGGW
jgi:hypothetical protein